MKPVRKKKTSKARVKSTTISFPVDFFEHCQPLLNEVEFGGGDILQVYNVQQAKHRLMTAGMYIASTKVCMYTCTVYVAHEEELLLFVLVDKDRFLCYCVMYFILVLYICSQTASILRSPTLTLVLSWLE